MSKLSYIHLWPPPRNGRRAVVVQLDKEVMSYYTNYSGYYTPPSSFRFFPKGMKFLLIFTTGVFLFQMLLKAVDVRLYDIFVELFALWPLGQGFMVWQLVSYLFLHGGFFHILFNMLALWFFGIELENVWGTRRFLYYYFLCGVGAGISNIFIGPLFAPPAPTIGASGAIYGVLIAFGILFPNSPVYLFFLFPIKAKYLVAIFIGIELVYGITGTQQGIAHFAHLGGALVGFIYIVMMRKSIPGFDIAKGFFTQKAQNVRNNLQLKKSYRNKNVITDANFSEVPSEPKHKNNRTSEGDVNQEKLDEILDKISASGYDSLTDEEKHILFTASRKLN